MKHYVRWTAALLLLSGCQTVTRAEVEAAQAQPVALVPVRIATAKGIRHYRVEVARTGREQARGLMFRTSLPADGGMIFPFSPPRDVSFWMRNTLIPLDMIFIRADGTIARIVTATPQSLALVGSGEDVAAVLEIAGGAAAKAGIAAGDKVTWAG